MLQDAKGPHRPKRDKTKDCQRIKEYKSYICHNRYPVNKGP